MIKLKKFLKEAVNLDKQYGNTNKDFSIIDYWNYKDQNAGPHATSNTKEDVYVILTNKDKNATLRWANDIFIGKPSREVPIVRSIIKITKSHEPTEPGFSIVLKTTVYYN